MPRPLGTLPGDVHVQIEPVSEVLSPEVLDQCLELWGGARDYAAAELTCVVERVRLLLFDNRARGRVVRDDRGRVRAFGVAAFVKTPLVDSLLENLQPHLGRQILLRSDWHDLILTDSEVAAGNAGSGLHTVVLNQGYDESGLTDEDWAAMLGTLLQAFIETHAGFRIARVVNEAFGARGAALLAEAWPDVQTFDGNAQAVPSAVLVVTRAKAERQGGALLPMFVYRPPRLRLTPAEQAVLRVALSGAPDPVIRTQLSLTKPALTARWSRILRRWAEANLGPNSASPENGKRGQQMRHLIVEYVRRHPAELAPFRW